MQGEAEGKLLEVLHNRNPDELHTVASDDSDATIMSLCLPSSFNVHVSAKHKNLSTKAVSEWVERSFCRDDCQSTVLAPASSHVRVDSLRRVRNANALHMQR
jgi:hypothetical protein